ncbi:Creatinase/aminopeptidase [Dendrothele bispora CBS 962.96]|uniref:Creatinase/aminopeptidase n=1 Tax=Dendrothele bispora (strain CBS 962.96) TaxID=1314807 RepID=A0A4S8MX09_DENBC|nr:Creatinase/aminopeptidase [Dendrothele bispora CBS 962.96]
MDEKVSTISTPIAGYRPQLTRLVCLLLLVYFALSSLWAGHPSEPRRPSFSYLADHCTSSISPIGTEEFLTRQKELAITLHNLNGSAAYVTEPSANGLFFANVSTVEWRLSERPLLLIITPKLEDGEIHPKLSVLAPRFEATRAKLLPIPFAQPNEIEWIEWPEEASPYELAVAALGEQKDGGIVFVDSATRYFVVDGLQKALPQAKVVAAPVEIKQLRERKSKGELEIMKCAHETTLLSIREVHKRLYIGMRESEAREMIATALADAGLSNGGCLTLFGDNAALPHGSGSDRTLGQSDFALFDCTGNLLGYQSDVTRTVALPDSKIPSGHLFIWERVQAAQLRAHDAARAGTATAIVDEVARSYLQRYGYEKYFTHRLGHGIGIEGHESPYLVGGSKDIIKTGHTFSNEPGVYIEGKVGVRLEDCFYIDEKGNAVLLTEGVGGTAKSALKP